MESVGSSQYPFQLAIIGCGPAGTAVIIRAIRLGLIGDLCKGVCSQTESRTTRIAGVALFDKDSPNRFGGGKLQDYIINSNTFGSKFVVNVVHDRPGVLPPEISTGTPLESLKNSKIASSLLDYNFKCAPLATIGKFLVEVGSLVHDTVQSYPQSRCFCNTEVVQLQRSEGGQLWRITAEHDNASHDYYASTVVIATGGSQSIPRLPPQHSIKLLTSDALCTVAGVADLRRRMLAMPPKRARVVIVGGSHSAFSAAWICLNKLDIPSAELPPNSFVYILHRGPIKVFYNCKRDAEKDGYCDYSGTNKMGQIHPFCGLRGDAKNLYRNIKSGKECRVRLLPMSHLTMVQKLYDDCAAIVWACGYTSNICRVLESNGDPISFCYHGSQIEVNDQAEVMCHGPVGFPPIPVPRLLASGLGFGLKANENGNDSDSAARADGVAVYLKRSGTLILSHVLGARVFGEGANNWEQHVQLNLRRTATVIGAESENDAEGDEVEASAGSTPATPARTLVPTSPIRRQSTAPASGRRPVVKKPVRNMTPLPNLRPLNLSLLAAAGDTVASGGRQRPLSAQQTIEPASSNTSRSVSARDNNSSGSVQCVPVAQRMATPRSLVPVTDDVTQTATSIVHSARKESSEVLMSQSLPMPLSTLRAELTPIAPLQPKTTSESPSDINKRKLSESNRKLNIIPQPLKRNEPTLYATPIRNGRQVKLTPTKLNDRAKQRPVTVGNSNRSRNKLPVMKPAAIANAAPKL